MTIGASSWPVVELEHVQDINSCCDKIWETWELIVTVVPVTLPVLTDAMNNSQSLMTKHTRKQGTMSESQ